MTANNFKDLTGNTYNRLTVLYRGDNQGKRTMWVCQCSCGNTKAVRNDHLKTGAITSCGCYSKESHTKHDRARTVEYITWVGIKQRTTNPNSQAFNNYGERGITICSRWLNSFESFYADMGDRPNSNFTIERIDNDKGYSPDNCKWATRAEQVRNRRNTILVTIDGKTLCLKDWCRHFNVKYTTVRARLARGVPTIKALTR